MVRLNGQKTQNRYFFCACVSQEWAKHQLRVLDVGAEDREKGLRNSEQVVLQS